MRENASLPNANLKSFWPATKAAQNLRAGLYAPVATNDQQTLAMENQTMREYPARGGWKTALQVREVNSAANSEARKKLLGGRPSP